MKIDKIKTKIAKVYVNGIGVLSEHKMYGIQVSVSFMGNASAVGWTIERSERDFAALHSKLRQSKDISAPDLFCSRFDIVCRISAGSKLVREDILQQYLDALCDVPEIIFNDAFSSFLIGTLYDTCTLLARAGQNSSNSMEESRLHRMEQLNDTLIRENAKLSAEKTLLIREVKRLRDL